MARFVDADPVEALATALTSTVALRGHARVYGDGDTARQTGPQRIVLQPEDGDFVGRAKAPSMVDMDMRVVAAIWGESRAQCWDLLRRLVQGVREHGRAGGPLVEWTRASWYTGDDTSLQGEPLTVRFVLRAQPITPPDPDVGLVESTRIEAA